MAIHSSIHAWKIPRTEEPGRLQTMGSQRVRTGLSTKDGECGILAPRPGLEPVPPTLEEVLTTGLSQKSPMIFY